MPMPETNLACSSLWHIIQSGNFWTALLCIVTGFYVILTRKILKSNQQAVCVMREQMEASLRPYIGICTFIVPGNSMVCLKISNTGKTSAENVRIRLDRDFFQYGRTTPESNLTNAYVFQNTIKTFPPGTELLFYLGLGFQIFDDKTDPKLTPPQFTVNVRYNYSGREVCEETTIDLEAYRMTSLPPQEAIVTQLKEIVKAIDKLQ